MTSARGAPVPGSRVELPSALSPWAPWLSELTPALALAIGPMVRTIDELIRRGDTAAGTTGELDGYSGLTNRGDPNLIALSEWAVASVFPEEFIRRAAHSELLHLQPNHVQQRVRGRVVAVVDCGPETLGAARLVQLAVLIVLYGRAHRRGTDLTVGLLGGPPGRWTPGAPRDVLTAWLSHRNGERPTPDEVDGWLGELDAVDEAWLFAGTRLATAFPGRRRLVTAVESAWTDAGASAAEVTVDGHRVELRIPRSDVAIRALRRSVVRIRRTPTGGAATLRRPAFTSGGPAVLARGAGPEEVVRLNVPSSGKDVGRPARHRFSGPVITAAAIGRRVVALVAVGTHARIEIHGKHLADLDGTTFGLDDVGLTPDTARATAEDGFSPLLYEGGRLLLRLDGRWWRASAGTAPRADDNLLAAVPGVTNDRPLMAFRTADLVHLSGLGYIRPEDRQLLLSPGAAAYRDPDSVRFTGSGGRTVPVPDGEDVIGISMVDDALAVVTVTAARSLLRVRWPTGHRTVTAWSESETPPALHPTRPWIVVTRRDRLVVGDLATGEELLVVPHGAAP